jgi:hypothetical protein
MEIKVISGNVLQHYKETTQIDVLELGVIKQNTSVKVKVEIKDVDSSTLMSTCRCSVVNSDIKNVFEIEYIDNNILAPFAKTFQINAVKNNKPEIGYIKIKGQIK